MCFFQFELLTKFPTFDSVKEHRQVLNFASGLSHHVGQFLCHHHLSTSHNTTDEKYSLGIIFIMLKENHIFSQDVFKTLFQDNSIKVLDISDVTLSETDIQCLVKAIRAGKLTQLKTLRLALNTLTGCLKDLLEGPDHPGFPSLEILDLGNTHLSWEDVESLREAVRAGKLPHLKELDLLENTLTGCLKDLFGGPDHPGFPSLEILDLGKTALNWEDVKSLSEAVRAGKLPYLKELKLSWNTLTGCLKDLFGGPDHPGFLSLEILDLGKTDLNRENVESLGEAVQAGKLPQLKKLNLKWNTLTGCLKDLFGGPDHPGFPSLENLDLWNTHLNQEDVESLSEAVRARKLPQLTFLFLKDNDLRHMEREVEDLIAACDAHCEKWVYLFLWDPELSKESMRRCGDKYHDVEILRW